VFVKQGLVMIWIAFMEAKDMVLMCKLMYRSYLSKPDNEKGVCIVSVRRCAKFVMLKRLHYGGYHEIFPAPS
jgi:hypothetical protein